MADTTVGVEFTARTAAAVSEIGKLSAATREQAAAADAAGKGQKGLGRDIKDARAAQLEATEATRKAVDAERLHDLTLKKLGESSKEAKASAAALAVAQGEVRRTSMAAAAALEKTTKAVVDAAQAEDGKLSAATQRAAAQLERLGKDAERASSQLVRMELGSQKGGSGFDLMGMAGGKLMSVLGPAALGGTLISLAGWLGEAGEKTLQYETAMANLPFTLDAAKAATGGLIGESKLAVAAGQALALGVAKTGDKFAQLAGDSAKIALKLGVSAEQMLGDLTSALGRGSAELLDNAGIMVKRTEAEEAFAASLGKTVAELTEAEKKAAFQAAAMDAIRKSADATVVSLDSNAAALARMKVQGGDAWDALERGASNFFGVLVKESTAGATALEATYRAQIDMNAAYDLMVQTQMQQRGGLPQEFKDAAFEAGEAAIAVLGLSELVAAANDPALMGAALRLEAEKTDELKAQAHFVELQQKALERIAADQESFLEAQAMRSVVYGPELPPKEVKKKRSSGKSKAEKADDAARKEADEAKKLAEESYDFEVEMQLYAAKESKSIREEAWDDEEKVFEEKEKIFERELEIIDARGGAEKDAQEAREALLDRRLSAEHEFAQQQAKAAKTDLQREAATTRLTAVEHQKRLVDLRRAAAAEEKVNARKTKIMEEVTGRISDLGGAMADAAWESADAQKGAGLQALSDYLKTVSKQMAIKALVETALGVSALAGVVTAGLAPGHFTAAGIAAGVALAAGGAAIATGAGAKSMAGGEEANWQEQQDEKERKDAWKEENGYGGEGGGGGGGSSGSGGGIVPERETRELEKQEVPISYLDSRPPAQAAGGSSINIDLSGGLWIGAKGPEDAAQQIEAILRRGNGVGKR